MSTPVNRAGQSRPLVIEADPPLWRDPPRLALVVAALGLIVGSVLPWAVGTGVAGRPESYRATQGTGEGVIMIAGGLLLLFMARKRLLWETASRQLQLLPLIVAMLSAVMWIGAEHFARQNIAQWTQVGHGGELTTTRWIVGGAILLILAAFAWLEIKRPAHVRRRTKSLWKEWGLTGWSVATVLAALTLGAAGAAVGVVAGMLVEKGTYVLIAIFLGIFGLFIGIGLGVLLVRELEAFYRRRR